MTKWLRLLGFDTRYESELTGKKVIETLEKDRVLLTRTRRVQNLFASRRLVFIESDHVIFKMSAMQCADRN